MMMILWVIVGFIVYDQLKNRNIGLTKSKDLDTVELLKKRYAGGEIDEETYKKIYEQIK